MGWLVNALAQEWQLRVLTCLVHSYKQMYNADAQHVTFGANSCGAMVGKLNTKAMGMLGALKTYALACSAPFVKNKKK